MTARPLLLLLLAALLPAPAAAAEPVTTVDLVTRRERLEIIPGRRDTVVTLNGGVPGPVLRFREGDTVAINLRNELDEPTAIHWHGLLVPGHHDGAPGFNGFPGIAPGETYGYRFTLRQSGTYWYHSHAATQEQAGQYGALIIDPRDGPDIKADREHVLLLTEHTREDPERILRNLKADAGHYNWDKRTLPEMLADASRFGLGATLADRAAWGRMRMDPTDIADVTGYTLLVNGKPGVRAPFFEMHPGERVRLRLINGSAMSFMDVRIPGLAMTIVAADGRPVEPVLVDEFRMAVAETYDVIVEPQDDRAYALVAETIDRRASLLATLGPRPGMPVEAPAPRPRQILMMGEMGHTMPAGGKGDPHAGHAPADAMTAELNAAAARQPAPGCTPEHAAMGHCTMAAPAPAPSAAPAPAATCTADEAAMGFCDNPVAAPPAPAAAPTCTPEHAAMGHCTLPAAPPPAGSPRVGTAVALAARPEGGTPFPRVDYGYGQDPMAGMDHSAMGHAMRELGREGDTDGSGRVFGWATGAPYGARVLSMRDLVAATPHADARAPTREIVIRVTGNMERYIWTLNGKPFGAAPPVEVNYGERVRITFVNETMMAHPMHLHGMFFEVENGAPPDRLPEKNVIAVAPGRTQSILLTADEPGEWPLHCHLLYHMESGMMQKLVVARVAPPAGAHDHGPAAR